MWPDRHYVQGLSNWFRTEHVRKGSLFTAQCSHASLDAAYLSCSLPWNYWRRTVFVTFEERVGWSPFAKLWIRLIRGQSEPSKLMVSNTTVLWQPVQSIRLRFSCNRYKVHCYMCLWFVRLILVCVDGLILYCGTCWQRLIVLWYMLTASYCTVVRVDSVLLSCDVCWQCLIVLWCMLTASYCLVIYVDSVVLYCGMCWQCLIVLWYMLTVSYCIAACVDSVLLSCDICWQCRIVLRHVLTASYCLVIYGIWTVSYCIAACVDSVLLSCDVCWQRIIILWYVLTAYYCTVVRVAASYCGMCWQRLPVIAAEGNVAYISMTVSPFIFLIQLCHCTMYLLR
jgi:hypothetical protein